MITIGIIPARYDSSRFPGKPLADILGKSMIQRVYEQCKKASKLNDVIIATDDHRILSHVKEFGGKAILTSKLHKTGTERCNEVAKNITEKFDLIVNIQGDEPLISPKHIDQVVDFHLKNNESEIILPSLKLKNISSYNIVKIVADKMQNVMYLSRSKIPHNYNNNSDYYLKHLSIISFTPDSLKRFSKHPQTRLEKIEGVELLRALEIGLKIKTVILKGNSFSVDIKEDLIKAKRVLKKDKLFKFYSDTKDD